VRFRSVLRDKAERLFETPASADFQLKLDSLCLDAAMLRDVQHQRIETERKIEAAIDRLAPFDDPESAALKSRLSEALSAPVQQSQSLAEKAEICPKVGDAPRQAAFGTCLIPSLNTTP
jgi:hypothetical protein